MDKLNLVDKLKENADISYEEAKFALENNNWDILEAMIYLENIGKVKKPEVSEFYTNTYKGTYDNTSAGHVVESVNYKEKKNYYSKNDFEGFFEAVCKVIDTGNNIFLEVSRKSRTLIKLPITVIILLLIFAFWFIIPLMIIGLFFEIEFSISSKRFSSDKIDRINKIFKELSIGAQDIVDKIKKGINNG
ncbi:MAG: ubiquitin [Clostridium sp.]|nr:ubiquitin [Clostridium sp.]MDU7083129.1 ubiquitin [Clostridium sp.]